jgi:hypothetical protein
MKAKETAWFTELGCKAVAANNTTPFLPAVLKYIPAECGFSYNNVAM